jgi:ABC-type uncharacterized transport system fused permease/ATPase subunit
MVYRLAYNGWRAWLTSSVVSRWLTNGRYYQLNLVSGDHQNPEYRIAEDLRVATDAPVDFAAGVTSAFLSASRRQTLDVRARLPRAPPDKAYILSKS